MLAAAALFTVVASRVAVADDTKCEGKITKIEGNQISVKTTTEEHQLTVGPATKITVDGKPAKSTDLKVGQRVKCTAEKDGTKLTCTSIEATQAAE
jgi:hypothetical protein